MLTEGWVRFRSLQNISAASQQSGVVAFWSRIDIWVDICFKTIKNEWK